MTTVSPPLTPPAQRCPKSWARAVALWLALVALAATPGALAESPPPEEFVPIDEWIGEDGLNGDAIYDRVLENRFRRSTQLLSLSSKDRGDHRQFVMLETKYLREDEHEEIVSRSIAKYIEPVDARHMGYLVINKKNLPDDQFVYQPSARRVRRINARTEVIAGTDFNMEDVIPQEADDGAHYRLPDVDYKGTPAYVIAVVPHEHTRSSYSKFEVIVEKERAIPLQTEYWDDRGVKIKQLRADPKSIELFDTEEDGAQKKVWIIRRSKMMHLKRGSQTVLNVLDFDANPDLGPRDFSQRKLTASR